MLTAHLSEMVTSKIMENKSVSFFIAHTVHVVLVKFAIFGQSVLDKVDLWGCIHHLI